MSAATTRSATLYMYGGAKGFASRRSGDTGVRSDWPHRWRTHLDPFLARGLRCRSGARARAEASSPWNRMGQGRPGGAGFDQRCVRRREDDVPSDWELSLIHISEPTRQAEISYAVFCLK